jgi:HAD superfamily hydrolase (TIGR01509 family)
MAGDLAAVVFDVDGTLVDSERFGHRVAFNGAFACLGLPFHWDEVAYGRLLLVPGSERRLEHFLAGEGVPDGERRRLVVLLHAEKTRRLRRMIDDGLIRPRPGVTRLLGELASSGIRLGVATAGTRSWVLSLLERVFPTIRFQVVVTTSDVAAPKPDPACYRLALERLGVPAPAALAVEDSAPGLAAASGAGLSSVVVVNDYTAGHDLDGAALALDGFGAEARLLSDPYGLEPPPPLALATLQAVLGAAGGHHSQLRDKETTCTI